MSQFYSPTTLNAVVVALALSRAQREPSIWCRTVMGFCTPKSKKTLACVAVSVLASARLRTGCEAPLNSEE